MTTTAKTTKYYIIETNYVGPNKDKHVGADKLEIRTSPALTNQSHEVLPEGWCGTTNDFAVYAHGEYDNIDAACAAIAAKYGVVRGTDCNGDRFESDDEDVVETYKPGKYAPISCHWAWEYIQSDIRADTTDERIEELVAEYEAEANLDGYTLESGLEDLMTERRQELRDELEEAWSLCVDSFRAILDNLKKRHE